MGQERVMLDGRALFASGPCQVRPGELALRQAVQEAPGQRGVRVVGQGVEARPITQTGTLLADSAGELKQQTAAIEAYLDGQGHELIDERGLAWPDVVMTRFEPGTVERVGPRWQVGYRVTYVQARV